MAIGFSPNHSQTFEVKNLSPKEILLLFVEIAENNNWAVANLASNGIIAYTNKGMFSWNAEIRIVIQNTTVVIKSTSTGSEIFDLGKNKKLVKKCIEQFEALDKDLFKEEIAAKQLLIEDKITIDEAQLVTVEATSFTEKIGDFFSLFKPVEGYFITPILINLNIFIFALMVFMGVSFMAPTTDSLIQWGANFRPVTLQGQWWRLLTNCFLHIGFFHLLMNMFALMYIGALLEPYLGKIRFLSAYLLTGLLASVTSLWWHDLTVSAGASGAIFGMYGVFLILLTTDLIEENARKQLLTSIAVFVGYNLISGLSGGIDNAAHIGGLVGGLFIGYVYTYSLDTEDTLKQKLKYVSALTAFFLVISLMVCNSLNNDIVIYENKMKDFVEMEKLAMEVYSRSKYEAKEDLLYNIKDRGIYYWNENINLLNEADKLSLPNEIHVRNEMMREYCELRIKSFDLLYKSVNEDTDKYNVEIQAYDQQILSIMDKIKQ
ncbi:rhomboid family intramembrane serine protease [Flavobacterium sp. PL002]|uniref:rhomboid family intramembrane serine protease n=1 Tax=Flavobacterium sp. PL002 TaxID=1897058 RepID=UPI0017887805|nr:rhomboid family intramembrane serine protease [Flavobacterium sp. PL002]MBE0390870.1 Rhomboid protease GluP [Flavobacterium sp. PL002]